MGAEKKDRSAKKRNERVRVPQTIAIVATIAIV